MNELIKIENTGENPTVLGRELHAALGVESNYTTWMNRMIEYGFSEGTDFIPIMEESSGGRPAINHQMNLDMAKELCMIQRTDKGKQCRQYFIEIERRWNEPASVIARGLQLAHKQIESLTATNQKLLPMALWAESVMDSKDAISIGEAAKVLHLGIGQNRLFAFLRDNHILMPNNQPYQKYIDEGWFRCIESKYEVYGETRISIKTVVFQKGLKKIKELYERSAVA